MLSGKEIVLIISGGIVVYKFLDLVWWLKDCGVCVILVMIKGV